MLLFIPYERPSAASLDVEVKDLNTSIRRKLFLAEDVSPLLGITDCDLFDGVYRLPAAVVDYAFEVLMPLRLHRKRTVVRRVFNMECQFVLRLVVHGNLTNVLRRKSLHIF